MAVVCALVAAAVSGNVRALVEDATGNLPSNDPVLATIRERGELRLAVRRATLSYFVFRGTASGFEYELFERLARELGVRLSVRQAGTTRGVEHMLRGGVVDAAVLSREWSPPAGLVPVSPYFARNGEAAYPPTGAILVRERSKDIHQLLEGWLPEALRTVEGRTLSRRYFVGARRPGRIDGGQRGGARLSAFDALIARHAAAAGYDWRLVAALIFQESSFDPTAVSAKGAVGLMQLMPSVGHEVGIGDVREPEANIRAGVRYLKRLSELYPETRGEDRIAMVLTAYLLGPGHVDDARKLAREIGLDPDAWWGGVEEVLPLLEEARFHESLRCGYARGRDAVEYVHRVFRLHHLFRQRVGQDPARVASLSQTPKRVARRS
jgi:membrane-bound lytic murein transglycosylase MltF